MSMTRRLRKARFEEQATLEGFDFTAAPKLPAAQIRDLAALRWLHTGSQSSSTDPSLSTGLDPPSSMSSTMRLFPVCDRC
jgi:IstB-like ATP binding protein